MNVSFPRKKIVICWKVKWAQSILILNHFFCWQLLKMWKVIYFEAKPREFVELFISQCVETSRGLQCWHWHYIDLHNKPSRIGGLEIFANQTALLWSFLLDKHPNFDVETTSSKVCFCFVFCKDLRYMQKFRNSSGNLVATVSTSAAILFKVVRGYCRGEPQNIARGGERGG